MSSTHPVIWRVRFRTDITAAMRLVDGATIYNIQQVLPNMAKKDVTDLVCEVEHG
jgi:head-tail adaptor